MLRLRLVSGVLLAAMLLAPALAWCGATDALAASRNDKLSPEAVSALEFAKTHHPELAALLEQLRTNSPKDFDAAIVELDRTRERLERIRKNAPERYELELSAWKLDSRVRLLAARLAMGGDPGLEDELRDALADRQDLRIRLLKDDRDRTQRRLDKLTEQITDQERRTDDILNREFTQLRNAKPKPAAASRKKDAKSEVKPPAAKPADGGRPSTEITPPTKTNPDKKPAK